MCMLLIPDVSVVGFIIKVDLSSRKVPHAMCLPVSLHKTALDVC